MTSETEVNKATQSVFSAIFETYCYFSH